MSDAPRPGVVVDTMVISWLFDERPNPVADQYRVLIGRAPVVLALHTGMEASFRSDTSWVGCNKIHDGDRWIAAAAIRLRLPLVSHDAVFKNVPLLPTPITCQLFPTRPSTMLTDQPASLHAKNRLLHSERAIDLLAHYRGDEVRVAAKAFIDGAYI